MGTVGELMGSFTGSILLLNVLLSATATNEDQLRPTISRNPREEPLNDLAKLINRLAASTINNCQRIRLQHACKLLTGTRYSWNIGNGTVPAHNNVNIDIKLARCSKRKPRAKTPAPEEPISVKKEITNATVPAKECKKDDAHNDHSGPPLGPRIVHCLACVYTKFMDNSTQNNETESKKLQGSHGKSCDLFKLDYKKGADLKLIEPKPVRKNVGSIENENPKKEVVHFEVQPIVVELHNQTFVLVNESCHLGFDIPVDQIKPSLPSPNEEKRLGAPLYGRGKLEPQSKKGGYEQEDYSDGMNHEKLNTDENPTSGSSTCSQKSDEPLNLRVAIEVPPPITMGHLYVLPGTWPICSHGIVRCHGRKPFTQHAAADHLNLVHHLSGQTHHHQKPVEQHIPPCCDKGSSFIPHRSYTSQYHNQRPVAQNIPPICNKVSSFIPCCGYTLPYHNKRPVVQNIPPICNKGSSFIPHRSYTSPYHNERLVAQNIPPICNKGSSFIPHRSYTSPYHNKRPVAQNIPPICNKGSSFIPHRSYTSPYHNKRPVAQNIPPICNKGSSFIPCCGYTLPYHNERLVVQNIPPSCDKGSASIPQCVYTLPYHNERPVGQDVPLHSSFFKESSNAENSCVGSWSRGHSAFPRRSAIPFEYTAATPLAHSPYHEWQDLERRRISNLNTKIDDRDDWDPQSCPLW